jgi:ABC-type multidrug transport system ATPase subunit
MKIRLSNAGKRFNREWIFRSADLEFVSGVSYAVTGPNGSGKSTLLQTIGGMLMPSEGKVSFSLGDKDVEPEKDFQHISFCAPYLEVIEEMTLMELLEFHQHFKPLIKGFSIKEVIAAIDLEGAAHKQIRYYSSGMKQRVRLGQAIFSDTPAVLLDEPCSNLDQKGIDLYHHLMATYCPTRLVIVCSNDEVEYRFCQERIEIGRYKAGIKV